MPREVKRRGYSIRIVILLNKKYVKCPNEPFWRKLTNCALRSVPWFNCIVHICTHVHNCIAGLNCTQVNLEKTGNMKKSTTDISNYMKGRLKMDHDQEFTEKYILLRLKILNRVLKLSTWFIVARNIMTIPMCLCER